MSRPFRFRAAAALDLRLSEEERALQHLARTRLDLDQAERRAAHAVEAAAEAAADLARDQADGSERWRLDWHQSWIARQRREAAAAEQAAAVSAASVAHATDSANAARQRRRALERLRDRALRRHRVDAARHDSREMNLLANLRFLAGGAANEGMPHDD